MMQQNKDKIGLVELFLIFSKIGAFTIGGGYAMIPLIEEEIVSKKKYINEEDFMNLLAVAQSSPGVLAANIAIFVGYKLRGFKGGFVATLGAVLPSILIILAVAICFRNFKENRLVERIFRGLRPGVVALIAVPAVRMAKRIHLSWKLIWIPMLSALLIWQFHLSPIYIIIVMGVGGILVGHYKKRKL